MFQIKKALLVLGIISVTFIAQAQQSASFKGVLIEDCGFDVTHCSYYLDTEQMSYKLVEDVPSDKFSTYKNMEVIIDGRELVTAPEPTIYVDEIWVIADAQGGDIDSHPIKD